MGAGRNEAGQGRARVGRKCEGGAASSHTRTHLILAEASVAVDVAGTEPAVRVGVE